MNHEYMLYTILSACCVVFNADYLSAYHCRSEYVLFQPAVWDCKILGSVPIATQRTGLAQDRWPIFFNLYILQFHGLLLTVVLAHKCPLNLLQLFNWALEPAADETLDKLYELGYLDAAVWAEQNYAELIAKNDQSLVADWIEFSLPRSNFGIQSWVHENPCL
jgi:hypothetical protein